MAAVELLSAALAAEDVTEKTQKLDELKQQLDADADGAIAATLDAELPALVGLLSGEAAEPALGVATALARWNSTANALLEHGVVPVLVGALDATSEALYGALLAPLLADPSNFFVISSDFCHWGSRFRFTFHDKSIGQGAIHESVEWLDRHGMALIEARDNA